MKNQDTMMSSETQTWNTPGEVLDLVRQVAPSGVIDLDPCSNENSIVKATREFRFTGFGDNGLAMPWSGFAYCNPPYDDAYDWMAKCSREAKGCTGIIALVPARTDTLWFHEQVLRCDAICFWKGRITFLGAPNGAPFPSMLPLWANEDRDLIHKFHHVFSKVGWCTRVS